MTEEKNKKQMVKVRRRWKIIKFFLNLKKRRGIQWQMRKLIVHTQEIMHQTKIYNELLFFSDTLFINLSTNTSEDRKRFLNDAFILKLIRQDARIWDGDLNEQELLRALKSM